MQMSRRVVRAGGDAAAGLKTELCSIAGDCADLVAAG